MSSGARASDEMKKLIHDMRVRRSGSDQSEQIKFVKFKIGAEEVEVDKSSILKVKDLENEPDIYLKISSMLEETECCYAMYDCSYSTTETKKEDLVFIYWAPSHSRIHDKMIYSSTKCALNDTLQGIKIQMQINDEAEKDKSSIVEKLEANGVTVTALEGIPLPGVKGQTKLM